MSDYFPCCNIEAVETDRFIGCDGQQVSDELFQAQLQQALDREDYKDASTIFLELNRRKIEKADQKFHKQMLDDLKKMYPSNL